MKNESKSDFKSIWKSNRAVLLILAAACAAMLVYEICGVEKFILHVDPYEYYTYLPKWFIEGDFSYGSKYPVGVAVLELPFFALAHIVTLALDAVHGTSDADGYTVLYQYSVGFAAIFYYVLGSAFIYRAVSRFCEKKTAALTVLLLTVGTFLPLYCTRYGGFSHIFTYAMAAIFLNAVIDMERAGYRERAYKNFFFGLLLGILFLLRNVNLFLGLFYLLYGLGELSMTSYKTRLRKIFCIRRLAMNALGFALPVFLQMASWRLSTGHWITNSYEGETFAYLTSPKVYEILLSDAKGLLVNCPILILAFWGLAVMGWAGEKMQGIGNAHIAVTAVVLAEIAISSTWWCWWYGGVYGMRPFIDIFPFLSLAMGAFLQWVHDYAASQKEHSRERRITVVFWVIVIISFVFLNIAFLYGEYTGTVSQWLSNAWELRHAILFQHG